MDKTVRFQVDYYETNAVRINVLCLETNEFFDVHIEDIFQVQSLSDLTSKMSKVVEFARRNFGDDIILDNLNTFCEEVWRRVRGKL